jgi:transposase
VIFVGDDWSEDHHDIEVQDDTGRRLVRRRLPEGPEGMAQLHALVADHAELPAEVVVGIETDRGLWVKALAAAGYQIYAVNPKAVARYRDRHHGSGAKSDAADAKVLADLVRTDRHNHRPVAGDSDLVEAIKVLARAHQRMIWSRRRQANSLRSILREFYPAALAALGSDPADPEVVAILDRAPTPQKGRALSRRTITAALRRAGRRRNLDERTDAIAAALRTEQLASPAVVVDAYGAAVSAAIGVLAELNAQLAHLEAEVFGQHPDAGIVCSLPGVGVVVGARLLGEFGDDPDRYPDARARRNYAGTSPITIASGKKKLVRARHIYNRHLVDACYWWAFCALTPSAGARRYYDTQRAKGQSHDQALRALANKLVGILDGCLRHRSPYNETAAWANQPTETAA